jgi:phosphonopyruvate decarboxylase
MPTVANNINFLEIAKGCGYKYVTSINNYDELDKQLSIIKSKKVLSFIEIKCKLDSRRDLGRPSTTPIENKEMFMNSIKID